MRRGESNEAFWRAAGRLIAEGKVDEGSIMGGPCVRRAGEFVAMPHHKGQGIVLKLTATRVAELIATAGGEPFAPAGRVFREWVLMRAENDELWAALLDEACALAARK